MDLVEREAELRQLNDCVAAATAGAGRVALVSGEAGIGKTSLLREFAARAKGLTVWWGSCDALATPNPLAPLHDIARSARVRFGSLLDRGVQGGALFGEVIRSIEEQGPVLMVIEDAHWADESTLDLVKFVGRRIDRTHAVLAVTFRQDEVSASHPLRRVIGELPVAQTVRIELPRLSESAVTTLATRALRSPAGLHAACAGNPFFLTELLRHGSAEVPHTIRDLVLARFARLPEKARALIQLVSIVPARVERWLVDEILAPTPHEIEQCLDSGLLLAEGDRLAFRHELARVAIEEAISAPVSQSLHGQALDALAKRGASNENVARLAHHAIHARSVTGVLAYAPAAARQARERGARRAAAAHYRTALRFAGGAPPGRRVELLEAYAIECQATSQLTEAILARETIALLLASSGDQRAEGRNASQMALDLVVALRNREADASSRRAIALLEPLGPSAELANAYRVEAQLRMLDRDCAQGAEWARKAIELAEGFDDKAVLAAGYGTLGAALLYIDYEAGRDYLHRSLDLSKAEGLDYIAANGYANLGSASGELYRFEEADRYLQAAIEFATTHEIEFYRIYSLAWLGLCDLFRGRWDDARDHAAEALRDAEESSTARVMALCALGRLATRRGEPEAGALLDEALQLASASGTLQRIAPVRAARAEAAFERGDRDAAVAEAAAALPLARAHAHRWHVGELSYWLARAGSKGAAAEECAEPYARQLDGRWREAAEAWAQLDCPYEQARALADGDAEARLEALAIFERLGARPAAEGLRRKLRDEGVRGVPRGPRASTQRNPHGLTAREMEILQLVCAGLRNSEIAERLFRSVRTIEHHVDSMLAKLGARQRSEVADIARREGLVAGKMGTGSPAK